MLSTYTSTPHPGCLCKQRLGSHQARPRPCRVPWSPPTARYCGFRPWYLRPPSPTIPPTVPGSVVTERVSVAPAPPQKKPCTKHPAPGPPRSGNQPTQHPTPSPMDVTSPALCMIIINQMKPVDPRPPGQPSDSSFSSRGLWGADCTRLGRIAGPVFASHLERRASLVQPGLLVPAHAAPRAPGLDRLPKMGAVSRTEAPRAKGTYAADPGLGASSARMKPRSWDRLRRGGDVLVGSNLL